MEGGGGCGKDGNSNADDKAKQRFFFICYLAFQKSKKACKKMRRTVLAILAWEARTIGLRSRSAAQNCTTWIHTMHCTQEKRQL